jgi:stalled ribosome rescue protein Dom34
MPPLGERLICVISHKRISIATHCPSPSDEAQYLTTARRARCSEENAMSTHFHALVWIDHREAKIFHFNATETERNSVRSPHPDQHIHRKANASGSGRVSADNVFLKRVTEAISQAGAILITGPANAKLELAAFIKRTQPRVAERVSRVETLDHPGEGELLALGRTFLKRDDRLHAQLH